MWTLISNTLLKFFISEKHLQKCGRSYHSLDDFSKHHVFAIQPPGLVEEDKELGAVSVGAVVSHGHVSSGLVTQLKVLVNEGGAIDTLSCTKRHVF